MVKGDGEHERLSIKVYGAGIDFKWWTVGCLHLMLSYLVSSNPCGLLNGEKTSYWSLRIIVMIS